MLWAVYAIISAFLVAMFRVVEKKTLMKEHATEFSTVLCITTVLVSIPLLFFIRISISLEMVFFVYVASLFWSIGFLLDTKALRHMEISNFAPLMNLHPIVVALIAFFALGEMLSFPQLLGLCFIAIGSYVLRFERHHKGPIYLIIKMIKSKYTVFVMISAMLFAFSSIMDKFNMNFMEPLFYMFLMQTFMALNYVIIICVRYDGVKGIKHGFRSAGKWVLLAAIFLAMSRYFYALAVNIAYIALVVPIKKISTLISTIVGGEIFHEHRILQKIIACILMVIGAALILT
ncbi:MAG: EamA family transporter [Candidatus Aenigmarchaeota archaeon]